MALSSETGKQQRRQSSKRMFYMLPGRVSKWKRSDIEKLHIYYEQHSIPVTEIFKKIPKMRKLSSQQEEYIKILKGTNFGPNIRAGYSRYNWEHTEQLIEKAMAELDELDPIYKSSTLTSLAASSKRKLHTGMMNLITKVRSFLQTRNKKLRCSNDLAFVDEASSPFKMHEESYSMIVSAFAEMCGLRVEKGSCDNQTVWTKMRGNGSLNVISMPDFRYFCNGDNLLSDPCPNWLTVMEVKTKGHDEDAGKRRKTRGDSASRSSTSASTSSESSGHYSSTFPTAISPPQQLEKMPRPYIEYDVGSHTLGQHAGDLLLDLHDYMEQYAKTEKPSVLTMPGMIIDETSVYLTVLEMTYPHYEKLSGTEQLTSEDKATIYYSQPQEILSPDDIDTIMFTFVSLNNIESILK